MDRCSRRCGSFGGIVRFTETESEEEEDDDRNNDVDMVDEEEDPSAGCTRVLLLFLL